MSDLISQTRLAEGVSLRLIHGNITLEKVDAVVNAANEHLAHGGGVAAAIVRRGGRSIQDESRAWVAAHGPASHDRPALTRAGDLPAKYVIHAVGPRWGEGQEEHKLQSAVSASLQLADEKGLASIAFPAISTGIFGFPKALAARVILEAVRQYVIQHHDTSLTDIRVVLFDQDSVDIFAAALADSWPDRTADTE
jgi:O-acetyl-ADP-ribose deacetylase (regulator of RNase III)